MSADSGLYRWEMGKKEEEIRLKPCVSSQKPHQALVKTLAESQL